MVSVSLRPARDPPPSRVSGAQHLPPSPVSKIRAAARCHVGALRWSRWSSSLAALALSLVARSTEVGALARQLIGSIPPWLTCMLRCCRCRPKSFRRGCDNRSRAAASSLGADAAAGAAGGGEPKGSCCCPARCMEIVAGNCCLPRNSARARARAGRHQRSEMRQKCGDVYNSVID